MNRLYFKILRGFMGLNQTELGLLVGKGQSTIVAYELGTFKIPSAVAERVEELAKDIGITDMELVLLQELIQSSAQAKNVSSKAGVPNE